MGLFLGSPVRPREGIVVKQMGLPLSFSRGPPAAWKVSEKRASGGWGKGRGWTPHLLPPVSRLPGRGRIGLADGDTRPRECRGSPRRRSWSQGWGLSSSFEGKGRGRFPETTGVSVKSGVHLPSPQLFSLGAQSGWGWWSCLQEPHTAVLKGPPRVHEEKQGAHETPSPGPRLP